ncbi:hypothetical protein HQ520_00945 [bacterium]|nr:hypothetical protein [bacterium]
MKNAREQNQENEGIVEILPNALYRPKELKKALGIRTVDHLTKAGLRAVGDWYYGAAVLAACQKIWDIDSCQRASAGKEVSDDAEHATKEREVPKGREHGKIHPVPKQNGPDSILRQMEEIG